MQQLRNDTSKKVLEHFLSKYDVQKDQSIEQIKFISQSNSDFLMKIFVQFLIEENCNFKQNIAHLKLLLAIIEQMTKEEFIQAQQCLLNLFNHLIKQKINVSKLQQIPKEQVEYWKEKERLLISLITQSLKLLEQEISQLVISFFEVGKMPEKIILELIKQISEEIKQRIKHYTKDIIPKILSSCSAAKSEQQIILFAEVIGSIYNNLLLCIENQEYVNLDQINDMTLAIFQLVHKEWSQSKDYQIGLTLIGILIKFLPKEYVEKISEGIIKDYIAQIRKQTEITILEGFNKILEKLFDDNQPHYEDLAKNILVSLYELYRRPIFSSNYPFLPEAFQEKNQLLILLQNLAQFNIDSIIDFFIHRHNSKDIIEKVSSLWITNFLVYRNLSKVSYNLKKQLIASLQHLVLENDIELRFVLCEIMFSLCYNQEFLDLIKKDSSFDCDFILYFLVKQTSIHDEEIQERTQKESPPYDTTLGLLKKRALYILQQLTQDAKCDILVWPHLLEYIPNPNFSPGLSNILKSINIFTQKFKDQHNKYPEIDWKKKKNIPKIQTVLARMMVLLRVPNFFANLGFEIINSLQSLLEVYNQQPITSELQVIIKDIKFSLNQKTFSETKYIEQLHFLWKKILDHFNSNEWFINMNEDMIAILEQYKTKSEILSGHLLKLHGQLLTKIQNQETIKYQIDKFFNYCHNDFIGMQLNLNIQPQITTREMRMNVSEALGFVADKYIDVVIDKLKNILHCEIIQKKQQSGFGSSILGIFQKSEGSEDRIQDMQITIILVFGQICKRVDHHLLWLKIENGILNNVSPFFEKNNEGIQISVQYTISQIAKSFEEVFENCSEDRKQDVIKLYSNYRDTLMNISKNNFHKKKLELKLPGWNSICSLLRLQPSYSYELHLNFLNDCLQYLPDIQDEQIQYYKEALSNVFNSFIYHRELENKKNQMNSNSQQQQQGKNQQSPQQQQQNQNNLKKLQKQELVGEQIIEQEQQQIISCYESLSLIINTIDKNEKTLEGQQFFFEALLNALSNYKAKIEKKERKFVLQSISILLSHVFKKETDLSSICLMLSEKIFLGFQIYPNLGIQNIDNFNQELIKQLNQKLNINEIRILVNENLQRCTEEKNIDALRGYLSFTSNFYLHFLKELDLEQLEKIFQNFKQLYTILKQSGQSNQQDDEIILKCIMNVLEFHLHSSLQILTSEPSIFPINDFQSLIFQKISKTKGIVTKTFQYLTDIINNPENVVTRYIGNMITNSVMFLGYIISYSDDLLKNLANKCFFQIFATFLLRFVTCFDLNLKPSTSQEYPTADPSKITLWAFEEFIKHTEKRDLLKDITQGLMIKLISEDQLDDGLTELIMVLCKNSSLQDLNKLLEFLKPFIEKNQEKQRLLCFIVISQLIASTHFCLDFHSSHKHSFFAPSDQREYSEQEIQFIKNWYNYLIQTLLSNCQDSSEKIRETIFKGLGNITFLIKFNIAKNEVNKNLQLQQQVSQKINNNNIIINIEEYPEQFQVKNEVQLVQKIIDNEIIEEQKEIIKLETETKILDCQKDQINDKKEIEIIDNNKKILDQQETTVITQQIKVGTLNIQEVDIYEQEITTLKEQQEKDSAQALFEIKNDIYENILETLYSALDDTSESCIKNALNSLQNIIDYVEPYFAQNFVINLMLKVSSNFEKQNSRLRVTAFNLFGKLIENFSQFKQFENFKKNELHISLITIIVHLNDESLQVRNICKLTLERVCKALNQEILIQLLLQEDLENKNDKDQNIDNININRLKFLEKNEQLLIKLLNFFIKNYQDQIQLYIDCLIEFSRSPEDCIKCSGLISLMFIVSNTQLQLNQSIIEKIQNRLNEILSINNNSKITSSLLKGANFIIKNLN